MYKRQLYNYAPPEEHMELITTCASEQDIFLLIDEANKAGGPDNITAVVVPKSLAAFAYSFVYKYTFPRNA